MMEILFRGKRLDNGKWAYGFLVKHPSAVGFTDDSPWYISVPPKDPDDTGAIYNVDPTTVGQYTGLKDKNGKKIFGGDIVGGDDCNAENGWGAIQMMDGAFVIVRHGIDIGAFYGEFYPNDFTVVGNIHDNPKLLEDGETND